MAELKTRPTGAAVAAFIGAVTDDQVREDCLTLLALMRRVTAAEPAMWGPSIVGFGRYHYHYASGREGDWFLVGFSPRRRDLTIYLTGGFDAHAELLGRLGSFRTGKGCLFVKRLNDVDQAVLGEVLAVSVDRLRREDG
jgi:hypothetical protein